MALSLIFRCISPSAPSQLLPSDASNVRAGSNGRTPSHPSMISSHRPSSDEATPERARSTPSTSDGRTDGQKSPGMWLCQHTEPAAPELESSNVILFFQGEEGFNVHGKALKDPRTGTKWSPSEVRGS